MQNFSGICQFKVLYFGGRGLTTIEYMQLYLWFQKSYKHGTGNRNFSTKLYRNYYMCVPLELYAPYVYWHLMNVSTMHDDKHPFCLKIGTGAVHWYLHSLRIHHLDCTLIFDYSCVYCLTIGFEFLQLHSIFPISLMSQKLVQQSDVTVTLRSTSMEGYCVTWNV